MLQQFANNVVNLHCTGDMRFTQQRVTRWYVMSRDITSLVDTYHLPLLPQR
jgi:hypothetical protein